MGWRCDLEGEWPAYMKNLSNVSPGLTLDECLRFPDAANSAEGAPERIVECSVELSAGKKWTASSKPV